MDLMGSRYGQSCGQSLLDRIRSGEPMIINMADGRILTLSEPMHALAVMRDTFKWTVAE